MKDADWLFALTLVQMIYGNTDNPQDHGLRKWCTDMCDGSNHHEVILSKGSAGKKYMIFVCMRMSTVRERAIFIFSIRKGTEAEALIMTKEASA